MVRSESERLPYTRLNLRFGPEIDLRLAPFPKPMQQAILQLSLYPWDEDQTTHDRYAAREPDLQWMRFKIPFVMQVQDDLFCPPMPSPDISSLAMVPILDPETGEEVGEEPEIRICIMKNDIEHFCSHLAHYGRQLVRLEPHFHNWRFFEIACGYFLKAFFANGLEELLWHITTLEALVGEKREGITDRLASRLAAVLAGTERERSERRKQFKELYAFRSDLVHGNEFAKPVYKKHLRWGRCMTRELMVWFLNFLAAVQKVYSQDSTTSPLPDRRHLLSLLDLDIDDREHLYNLIARLPGDYPMTEMWHC